MIEKEKYIDKKTIIIALTANTLDNDRERCLKNGMDDYLSKPFNIKKLHIILETLNL
jgi:osomolarity two-component system sensor histidine kinase NIK1